MIASAWATLLAVGEDGYTRNAEIINQNFQLLKKLIGDSDGLRVVGDPGLCGFGSEVEVFSSIQISESSLMNSFLNETHFFSPFTSTRIGFDFEIMTDCGMVAFDVALGSKLDIFCVADALHEIGGWDIGRCQKPKCLHFPVGLRQSEEVIRAFVKDLRAAVARVQANPDEVCVVYSVCLLPILVFE